MDIVLTFDDNYSCHACATIASVCKNNKGKHVFHVLSDGIGDKNKKRITELVTSQNSEVFYYLLDKSRFENFPIGKGTANTYVSLATYYRLFIPELLPVDVKKVLYLDCDVIVNGCLEDLWNLSFDKTNECIYAVEEFRNLAMDGSRRLNYPSSYSYFNAGVLLINLKELRKLHSVDKAIAFIRTHEIKFHDQDVLNGLLYKYKCFLPLKYNLLDSFLIKNATFPQRYKDQYDDIKHPVIIHYSGPIKPWNKECNNPYKDIYWVYADATPWKGIELREKYQRFSDKMFFHMKNLVKQTLEVLHLKYFSYVNI